MTPTVRVNGRTLQEELSVSNVFSAICNSFSNDDRPDICRKCSNCLDITMCAENSGICPKHDDAIGDSGCPDTSESVSTNGSYSDTRCSTTSTATPNTYNGTSPTDGGPVDEASFVAAAGSGTDRINGASATAANYDVIEGISNKTLLFAMLFVNVFLLVLLFGLIGWWSLSLRKTIPNDVAVYKPVNLG